MFLEFNISLESDITRAQAIIQEETLKNPYNIDNRSEAERAKGEHAVMVRVMGFTELATQLRGYAWARTPNEGFEMKVELHKAIKERFDREGISLAIPLRMITYKNGPQ
jgi:small conductance mechanosensitive channel